MGCRRVIRMVCHIDYRTGCRRGYCTGCRMVCRIGCHTVCRTGAAGRALERYAHGGREMQLAIGITAAAAVVFGIALLADKLPEGIMEKLMKILR